MPNIGTELAMNKERACKQKKKREVAKEKYVNVCINVECKLRKAGCKGFEGCPGYKGR